MRDGRDVRNRRDLKTGGLQRADGRLAAGAGPLTKISICFNPCSMARRAVASAVVWAAKGVLFREPLKPWLPALPQASTLPWASVSETIVLLNVDWICAAPTITFFFSRRRVRTTFFFGITYFFSAAFLRTPTVLRGPRRVRALVRVRCPRTGSPRRWRRPR